MYGDHPDLLALTHSFPTRRSSDLGAVAGLDALDGRGRGDLDAQLDRVVAGLHDVANHDLVDRAARGIGKDVGIALEQAAAAGQPRAHVAVQAAAGGAVVVAPAPALEDAVARGLAENGGAACRERVWEYG